MRTGRVNRVIAAVLLFITGLLGLNDLNLDCGWSSVYGYSPLGLLDGVELSCKSAQGFYSDSTRPYETWASYAVGSFVCMCVCILALLTCGVLVAMIKKVTRAGFVIGLILSVLCLASLMYVVIVQPWMSDPITCLFMFAIAIVFLFSMMAHRRWLIWLWRVVLILIIIGPVAVDLAIRYHYNIYPFYSDTLPLPFLSYIDARINDILIFAALFVLAFAPRGTTGVEAIPREDDKGTYVTRGMTEIDPA